MSDEIMAKRVHFGFTDNHLVAALVASTGATFLATMFGEWFGAVNWPVAFSFNTLNAEVWANNFHNLSFFFPNVFGKAGAALTPNFTYFLGMWAHYSQGIFFGLLFAFFIYPNLPGPMKTGNNLVKGTLWGLTLVIVSNSYVMPLLYGSGFWFSTWGTFFPPNGQANLIFDNVVWHATYGFLLGMFFNPLPKADAGMGTSAPASGMAMGSVSQWGQLVLGWIVIIVGGYISTSSASAASWGVIPGLIGLIIATGPPLKAWRMKK